MDCRSIIKRALKVTRRKLANPCYAKDLEYLDSDEVMGTIKYHFHKELFSAALKILNRTSPVCTFAGTERYVHALVAALIENGAKENISPTEYRGLSMARLIVKGRFLEIYLNKGNVLIEIYEELINVQSEPKDIAELIDICINTPISSKMLTSVVNKSYALVKIEEILLPTAKQIIDEIVQGTDLHAEVFIWKKDILKILLTADNGLQTVSNFCTTIEKLEKDVQRKIRRHNKRNGIRENSTNESEGNCR